MKRKIFVPNELKNDDSFFSFGTASKMYWDFALKMESEAIKELKSRYNSFYVFPTVVFYCATFEALLNEGLTKLLLYNKNYVDEIDEIKNCRNEYRDLARKIRVCAKYLDRKKIGVIDENILQEYIALSEVRNAVLHYNPEFGGLINYPMKLQAAFNRSKVKAIKGADWVETFKTQPALDWAKEAVKNIINCFLDFQLIKRKDFYNE
jgi:hypothetical protein